MKLKITNDKIKRLAFVRNEPERACLQFLARCQLLPVPVRMQAQFRLQDMTRRASATFHRDRCMLTGYNRWVIPEFAISRHVFKDMAMRGEIHGVKKACW